jgi:methionine-rich copper-binding protein CopC
VKRAALAIVLILLALGFAGAAPAVAHTELVSSSPADGTELDAAPDSVEFVFNEDLLPQTVSVAVQAGDSPAVPAADVRVTGPTVTAPWPAAITSGPVTVNYRVVSADGHPIQGVLRFVLPAASTPAASTPAASTPAASTPAASIPSAPTPSPAGTATPIADAQPESGSLVPPIAAISLGLGIGVAIGLAYYLRSRRSP